MYPFPGLLAQRSLVGLIHIVRAYQIQKLQDRLAGVGLCVPAIEGELRSDFMFGQVMRSEEICQLFLEALLGIKIQRIEFIDHQKDLGDSYESCTVWA